MQDIFKPESDAKIRPFYIILNARKTTKFGSKSLTALGPKIWNHLSAEVKIETSFLRFKKYIKTLFGPGWMQMQCLSNYHKKVIWNYE